MAYAMYICYGNWPSGWGVLYSVNFGCFVPSRSECFQCNATRKAIKVCMNLHTIQQIEHIPVQRLQYRYSVLAHGIGGSRGGREGRTPPPGRPNSFDFMQFSGKFGVFTPPLEGSRPPLGKILDPPLYGSSIIGSL